MYIYFKILAIYLTGIDWLEVINIKPKIGIDSINKRLYYYI